MKALVTGGAGFIGSHLVDSLVERGYTIRVIDNLSTGKLSKIASLLKSKNVDFIEGDIRDSETAKKCIHGIDAVYHLAATTSVPFSLKNPELTYDTNVTGTLNLLTQCAEQKVSKFIFSSSCAVYGEPMNLPINEKHPTNPISPYAESKLEGEQHCLNFHKKQRLKAVVLRLFNVYGTRQGLNEYSGVITQFINRARKRLPLIIYGDGSQTRDFVHVRDVVEAILSATEIERAEGKVFNIGSGKPTSIQKLAQTISELYENKLEILHDEPRLGDIKQSYAEIAKAAEILNYMPQVSLKDGLCQLIEESS